MNEQEKPPQNRSEKPDLQARLEKLNSGHDFYIVKGLGNRFRIMDASGNTFPLAESKLTISSLEQALKTRHLLEKIKIGFQTCTQTEGLQKEIEKSCSFVSGRRDIVFNRMEKILGLIDRDPTVSLQESQQAFPGRSAFTDEAKQYAHTSFMHPYFQQNSSDQLAAK